MCDKPAKLVEGNIIENSGSNGLVFHLLIMAFYCRRSLRRGESVKYLLQDAVVNYIKEHQLYHNNETLDK